MKVKITERDLLLFKYLHEHKVATVKQIRRDIIVTNDSTAWTRLQKLRMNGFIKSIGTNYRGDKSTIFCLNKRGYDLLLKTYPGEYLFDRVQSNSIEHDLKLVDIRKLMTAKNRVLDYWTENTLQTSAVLADDDKLSSYRMFQFDALMKVKNGEGSVHCGLEYEYATKSKSDYDRKLAVFYRHSFLKAVFYICDSQATENAIKKAELRLEQEGHKKLYFAQYEQLTSGGEPLTFRNQDNQLVTIS